ncbi:unnamed protein product [Medioppia subpectinata]|uniref:Uncharacterized protein n=1 Tax=Medioppia subpectinata TaxID=1979941 RepID=A0A7R9M161_9ACAR|nr:unnamed protein product [Medioppia subpectinata]CAG2123494.1 unnamed protein product [Medioppia subpectinata]
MWDALRSDSSAKRFPKLSKTLSNSVLNIRKRRKPTES